MNWSDKTPKQNGFYWLKKPNETPEDTIVYISDIEEGLVEFGAMVAFVGSDYSMSLCNLQKRWKCYWYGPLTPIKH